MQGLFLTIDQGSKKRVSDSDEDFEHIRCVIGRVLSEKPNPAVVFCRRARSFFSFLMSSFNCYRIKNPRVRMVRIVFGLPVDVAIAIVHSAFVASVSFFGNMRMWVVDGIVKSIRATSKEI